MTGTRHATVIARSSSVSKPSRSRRGRSTSPAARPRRARPRAAPTDRIEPVASRPPLTTTSQRPVRRRRRRPDARRSRRRPPGDRTARAHRPISVGSATAAVLSETLSAPARRTSRISSTLRTPPPTVSGMKARRAVRSTMSRSVPRRSGAARDVEEDQLVGALARVALGELGRIALVDEVDEAGALHDAAVGDVEAGDDPAAQHQAPPGRDRAGPHERRRSSPAGAGRRCRCARGGTGRRAACRGRPPRRTACHARSRRGSTSSADFAGAPAYEWTK